MRMPSPTRKSFGILCLALAWAVAGPAAALAENTDEDCMACHADASMTRADGKPVVVDAAKFTESIHGQMGIGCVACHTDVATAEIPHPDKLAKVDCGTCHSEPVEQYNQGIHATKVQPANAPAATCVSCHGMHDIRSSKDPESRTYHLNLAATCATCHGNDAKIQQEHIPGGNIANQFRDSIHGQALRKAGLLVAPNCSSCHGAHKILPPSDANSKVSRARIPGTCGECHEGIENEFLNGKHGEQMQKDNPAGPVCTDCHSAHQIQRPSVGTWRLSIMNECGSCHLEQITTYRDTFHGKVTSLGFTQVATCADCHGAHQVLPASDPSSTISAKNRLETCRKCHPGANANFALYDPHADRHNKAQNPPLYYAGLFMDWLLLGVFGFFGIHTSLWFFRSWRVVREHRRARPPARTQNDQK